jgi:preprotein translocase subunit SecF
MKNFNFIKARKISYILSLVIIVAGIVSLIAQGLNLGIDFTGGTVMEVSFSDSMEIADLRQDLADIDYGNATIVQMANGDYQIKMPFMDQTAQDEFISSLNDATGNEADVVQASAVGPSMGTEIFQKGIIALVVAIILMVAYISFRFEWRFALAGNIALFHDIFVTLAFFSLFQWEVNSSFIAAILTIFGYSINDTIVVFDRIRENLGRVKREDLGSTVDRSIKSVIRRSLYTSISTLIPLIAVCAFGGDTTRLFVLAMIIGITSGTYSSIVVASPLWYDISMKSKKKRF